MNPGKSGLRAAGRTGQEKAEQTGSNFSVRRKRSEDPRENVSPSVGAQKNIACDCARTRDMHHDPFNFPELSHRSLDYHLTKDLSHKRPTGYG